MNKGEFEKTDCAKCAHLQGWIEGANKVIDILQGRLDHRVPPLRGSNEGEWKKYLDHLRKDLVWAMNTKCDEHDGSPDDEGPMIRNWKVSG